MRLKTYRHWAGLVCSVLVLGCNPSKDIVAAKPDSVAPVAGATTSTGQAPSGVSGAEPSSTTATDSKATTTAGASGPASKHQGTKVGKDVSDNFPDVPDTHRAMSSPPTPPNPNRAFQLSSLAHAVLWVNKKPIDAWIMDTEDKREEGMMFLTEKEVRDNQGMIFVFRDPQLNDGKHGFWMHNTILPLDITYIASDMKVINTQFGKAQDDTSLPSSGTYYYVLELKHGQAAKYGIRPGTTIGIPSEVKAIN